MSEIRLQRLLEAHRAVMESLDVDVVLRRTVDAAVSLLDALDGAIVLFDRRGLADRVIHVAGSASRGPLADLDSSDLTPLTGVEREPRRAGISMDDGPEFLAVPLRSHGDAYGALYLTGSPGGPFTPDDEEMIVALAGTAAVALENGQLYDELQRQLRWSTALTEVSSALLSEDVSDAVGVVLARVGTVVAAAVISVVVPDPDSDLLLIHTARGSGAERFEGRRYERRGGLVDRALRSGRVVLSTAGTALISLEAEMGPSMVLPVVVAGESICALALSRSRGTAPFTADDVDMAAEFATQVGLAIEIIRARGDRHRVELAEERSRIARDLHDHVIQRLFGTGLSLQAVAARFPQAEGALIEQVDAIDEAIDEIRTAVFALTSRRRASTGSVRHRILDVVSEMSDSLRVSPQLTFRGPVDLMLTGTVGDDVIAVVRECLANVARHACSDVTTVMVSVDQGSVEVVVTDDGVGVSPDAVRRSGTGNLADRARRRGGDFTIFSAAEEGTRVVWWARLVAERSRV
ncbi:Redox sensor histidine kinase response regulator DevS [Microbacterium sp. Bi98]|nr:Redox sensor histidine kinase response regulator DevS [Microbacterium sp. Bi98]